MNQEIEFIYKKYLKVNEEEEELIENFIRRKLELGKIDFFDSYLDYENTKGLARELEDEEDIDIIKLYFFLKSDLGMVIDLDDARYYHEELQDKGCQQIQDYLHCYHHTEYQLEEIVEKNLVYDLEELNLAADLFRADELAEM